MVSPKFAAVNIILPAVGLRMDLTPFPAIRFYHPCTIANLVPQAHNIALKEGNNSPFPVSKSMKRLPTLVVWLNGTPREGSIVSGFTVCSARHMALGASFSPRKRLAAGRRGGKRV
jgi:hypothetical protein